MRPYFHLLLLFSLFQLTGCGEEEVVQLPDDPTFEETTDPADVFTVECANHAPELYLSVTDKEVIGDNNSSLRAVTAVKGTITKTNVKTFWTYGKGENLIPKYACGQYTISERYDMTVTVYPGPGRVAMNSEGEWMGWQIDNIGNPQTRFQAQYDLVYLDASDYKIKSTIFMPMFSIGYILR